MLILQVALLLATMWHEVSVLEGGLLEASFLDFSLLLQG